MPPGYRTIRRTPYADRHDAQQSGGRRNGAQAVATPTCPVTTLYDLIAAIQDVVGPEDDALVVATVVHLLRSSPAHEDVDPRVRAGAGRDLPAEVAPPDSGQGGGELVRRGRPLSNAR